MCVSMWAYAGTFRDLKRTVESLELEFQIAVSCPTWVLGTELCSSGRSASALYFWAVTLVAVPHSTHHKEKAHPCFCAPKFFSFVVVNCYCWSVCVCYTAYMRVCKCAHIEWPVQEIGCLLLSLSGLLTGDRVIHWTWSSLLQWGHWILGICLSLGPYPPMLGLQACVAYVQFFF